MTTPTNISLEFDAAQRRIEKQKALSDGLSAVVRIGNSIWLANDESVSIERLLPTGTGLYGHHRRFDLAGFLDLPVDPETDHDAEVDIEGLDYRDGFLWLVGSHSLKRGKPKAGKSSARNVERLGEVSAEGNRFLLARIPLMDDGAGTIPVSHADGPDGRRVAARLKGNRRRNELTRVLESDPHLAPFLEVPGKDNGFDVEGIAALGGGRVLLGLRGPVLRGWSMVLELQLGSVGSDGKKMELQPLDAGGEPELYRKHFLDLHGLGVRDLCLWGGDLLILAGPTMDLDGPVAVFRWRGGSSPGKAGLVAGDDLRKIVDLPYGEGNDHAEGMALWDEGRDGRASVLIVHDSAAPTRRPVPAALLADLVSLPAA